MPFSDLPLAVLVALYLAVFVLIGIYPALKRAAERFRKRVYSAAQSKGPVVASIKDVHAEMFTEQPDSWQLNNFEIIVLRRLAQAVGKDLSRKQVNEPLLLGTAILHKTLKSLYRRGLIHVKLSKLLGQRFSLSETGRRYAIEQGYIIDVQERKRPLG